MAKKPVQTYSLVKMAASLEAQNVAVLMLISSIETADSIVKDSPLMSDAALRRLLGEIATDARAISAKLWPDEES